MVLKTDLLKLVFRSNFWGSVQKVLLHQFFVSGYSLTVLAIKVISVKRVLKLLMIISYLSMILYYSY